MARVTLDGIRKVYENGYTAVHGISLDVDEGEFVVLVGPSGCGKTVSYTHLTLPTICSV